MRQSRLRSQVFALLYWDAASGQSVPLGFVQNAQAESVSETQVVYPQVAEPDLTDDFVDLGSMQIPWSGRASPLHIRTNPAVA